jgi:hypothetical protein
MFDPDVTDDCIFFTIISYLKLFESYEGSINVGSTYKEPVD